MVSPDGSIHLVARGDDRKLWHNFSHRKQTLDVRLGAIKAAAHLTTDAALINSSMMMARALASQMKTTLAAIKEFDQQVEELCQAHEVFELVASLPGAGRVYGSRLLAALGANRERQASADELLRFGGVAPVVERSGKSSWTRWRYFCPKFVRQAFVEYAGESIRYSQWAQAFYVSQKAKGKRHQAAVRALAYKWIRIIWKCWQTRTRYNEARYVECLRKKGLALVQATAWVEGSRLTRHPQLACQVDTYVANHP